MTIMVGIAIAYALGVDTRRLVLLAGAIHLPLVVGGLILLLVWRSKAGSDNRPSLFCEGVASELRAGSSLRDAIFAAATSVGGLSVWLSPTSHMTEVAAALAREFPSIGRELSLTVVSATRSGSDTSTLFDEIGSLALAQSEIRREVQIATAPGRVTALVLLSAPLIYLFTRVRSGGLSQLLITSQQRFVSVLGLALFGLGVVIAGLVTWRAGR